MALKISKHSSWKRAIAAGRSTAFIETVPALVLYENEDLADFSMAQNFVFWSANSGFNTTIPVADSSLA